MCQVLEAGHAARHGPDLDILHGFDFTHTNDQVAGGARLAEQGLALRGRYRGECGRGGAGIVHRTGKYGAQAGAAGAVAATVGQYNPLAQRGIEHGFGLSDRERMTTGLYGDLVCHSTGCGL